jgi:hypothetical protein
MSKSKKPGRTSPAEREAKRAKKAERAAAARAQETARLAEFKRQAAIRQEEIDEEHAPASQRRAVISLDGEVIRDALVDPDLKRGGYRRADPLRRMHNKNPGQVTLRHLAAVFKLSSDYEKGVLGGSGGGSAGERISGGTKTEPSDTQLKCAKRYREACEAMGEHRTYVQWMGLHQKGQDECRRDAGVRWDTFIRRLIDALDRLEQFYLGDRRSEPSAPPILVMAPAREAYSMEVEPAE